MDTQLIILDPELEGCSVEAQTKSLLVSTQTPLTKSKAEAGQGLPSGPAGIWHREFGGGWCVAQHPAKFPSSELLPRAFLRADFALFLSSCSFHRGKHIFAENQRKDREVGQEGKSGRELSWTDTVFA